MATNNSGLDSNYLLVSEKRLERRRERLRVRNNRRASEEDSSGKFMQHLRLEADRVLIHLLMFLPVFLHWIYKMKHSSYQHSFVILGWLVYWVVVEKCAKRQKEIGNHRFQK